MYTPQPSPTNAEKAIEEFLFHCLYEKNLSGKTISAYRIDLEQFQLYVRNTCGIASIEDVEKDTIKGYLQHLSHFKPKTVKRKIASVKAMFNYLEYESDDFVNHFRKIKIRLKESHTLPTVMTIDEVKKLLAFLYKEQACERDNNTYKHKAGVRNIAVVELLFATGVRVSELCSLKAEDVDLKNGTIKVFGKGSKERIIQICEPEIKASLRKYYSLFSLPIRSTGYFFINRLSLPLSSQSVRLMLHQYVKKVSLTKKITPHTFRHTFATLLLEEDVDVRYIQSMLGHSSITTTQLYTHINAEKQRKILAAKHPRRKLTFGLG